MKILIGVLAVLALAVLGLLAWMGAFGRVNVVEQELGPYPFVYVQDTTTDFGRIGELSAALDARLAAADFRVRRPMQVYSPVSAGVPNQIGFVVDRTATIDFLGPDTFFRQVPMQRFAVARFPFRNRFSFLVAHGRAESALEKHRTAKGYREAPAIVLLEGTTITFMQPNSQ
jgi:hypothetical protein